MKLRALDFSPGLNTQTLEETTEFPVWRALTNVISTRVGAESRKGIQRLARIAATNTILDFDGSNDYVQFDYDARTLGGLQARTSWSVEFLCQADSLSSPRTILHHSGQLLIFQDSTSSGRVVAQVTDTGANTLTLQVTGLAAGTRIEGRLSRAGSLTYTLTVNGTSASGSTTAAIASSTAVLYVGANGGSSNFYDGRIERVTLCSPYRTGRMGLAGRTLIPHAPSVLLDAVMTADANGYVLDRSVFGLHGKTGGSPTTTASLLSVNPVPIQAIGQTRGNSSANTVYVVAGGGVYPVTV